MVKEVREYTQSNIDKGTLAEQLYKLKRFENPLAVVMSAKNVEVTSEPVEAVEEMTPIEENVSLESPVMEAPTPVEEPTVENFEVPTVEETSPVVEESAVEDFEIPTVEVPTFNGFDTVEEAPVEANTVTEPTVDNTFNAFNPFEAPAYETPVVEEPTLNVSEPFSTSAPVEETVETNEAAAKEVTPDFEKTMVGGFEPLSTYSETPATPVEEDEIVIPATDQVEPALDVNEGRFFNAWDSMVNENGGNTPRF